MSPMSSVKRSCPITEPACLETRHWLAESFQQGFLILKVCGMRVRPDSL